MCQYSAAVNYLWNIMGLQMTKSQSIKLDLFSKYIFSISEYFKTTGTIRFYTVKDKVQILS